jgi:hypothetical protein
MQVCRGPPGIRSTACALHAGPYHGMRGFTGLISRSCFEEFMVLEVCSNSDERMRCGNKRPIEGCLLACKARFLHAVSHVFT